MTKSYYVSGKITSESEPLHHVNITVSYLDWKKEKIAQLAKSTEDGQFEIEIRFYPYSGSGTFGGDKCELILNEIQIATDFTGYQPTMETIKVSKPSIKYNKVVNQLPEVTTD